MVSLSELETQNILLNHVVLPRVLPQEKARFIHEQAIINLMVENVENLSDWLPEKTVEMMDRLKRVTREYTRTVVSEIINELEPGDSFSMFIRRQNCTIMFYIPPTEENSTEEPQNIIVATFIGTLHPKEIFKHESDIEVRFKLLNESYNVSNADNRFYKNYSFHSILLQFKYPMQAYKVKYSTMLQSEEFANQVLF